MSKVQCRAGARENFLEKNKHTYSDVGLREAISAKNERVKGDGHSANTIEEVIENYAGLEVIYFPSGYYVVTDTIYVTPGSHIIGEIWSIVLVKSN